MSKKENNFFVTTPIYYTNGIPHIGHAYASIIADSIARYQKINGKKVKFSTGVDENSQKAVIKAEEAGMKIEDYLDMMAKKHKAVWDGLSIEYTDFIRTTEKRHHKLVREVLQKSFDNGDIYEGEYEGMYCVGCEAFKKDEDLVFFDRMINKVFIFGDEPKNINEKFYNDTKYDIFGDKNKNRREIKRFIKVCPDHLTEPERIKEKNYFFKLSKYQKFLEDFYEENPDFVMPSDRFNEIKAFVKRGLEDFSISRETNKFGIKLPFDESQVTYVWYDALFNYITVCQNGDEDFWPANLHIVGKDIIRFHGIFWPAMLKSAGYELPKNILTTGFFTVDGQKISKSLGNVIDPVEFSKKYSKDLLTLYLLSSFNIGQDGDFDQNQAILTYNAKLANNLGNLVNRVVVLSLKLLNSNSGVSNCHSGLDLKSLKSKDTINDSETSSEGQKIDNNIIIKEFDNCFSKYDLKGALDICFYTLDKINKYVDETKPWELLKDSESSSKGQQKKAKEVLYTIAEGLRQVGLNLYPFFPEKMGEMFDKLGLENYSEKLENGKLKELRNKKEIFKIKEKGKNLFDRFEV